MSLKIPRQDSLAKDRLSGAQFERTQSLDANRNKPSQDEILGNEKVSEEEDEDDNTYDQLEIDGVEEESNSEENSDEGDDYSRSGSSSKTSQKRVITKKKSKALETIRESKGEYDLGSAGSLEYPPGSFKGASPSPRR